MTPWLSFEGTYQDFVNKNLSSPGVLVEVQNDVDKKLQFLIGDVSSSGSVMGGKTISLSHKVLRYQVIWHRHTRKPL